MRKQLHLLLAISGVMFTLLFTSCKGEDRRDEYKSATSINEWIYESMKTNYLWNTTLPTRDNLNFYKEPIPFFTSLLSSNELKNGRYYSTISEKPLTTKAIDEKSSYGCEFTLYKISTSFFARILYVLPQSPAEVAGLRRGDWVILANDKEITDKNYNIMLTGGGVKLTTGTIKIIGSTVSFTKDRELNLEAARAVDDNPVLVKKVLTSQTNRKVGYLMYTSFKAGIENVSNDVRYENALKQAFAEFKLAGVNEFVLDLRYNPGGLIRISQLMATMLAPQSALGKIFCTNKFNSTSIVKEEVYAFDASKIGSGANLNLSKLYVLVSNHTASASELVINGLMPYMPVTLIGTQTEGKNLSSRRIESPLYNWILQPIIGQLYNSLNFTDYSKGFIPNFIIDENKDNNTLMPLGDNNEPLLKKALAYIDGEVVPSAVPVVGSKANENVTYKSSLDRKANNGAW